MRILMTLALAGLMVQFLSCGMKGPLELPGKQDASTVGAADALLHRLALRSDISEVRR